MSSPVCRLNRSAMSFIQSLFGLSKRFEAAGENEVVGGAGAGDVQQPFALFEFVARVRERRRASCRWSTCSSSSSVGLRHERAELGVERGGGGRSSRRAIEIGHDDERELEALGVVDRHQANDVGRFGQRGGERFLRLAGDELGELRDEAVEVDGCRRGRRRGPAR